MLPIFVVMLFLLVCGVGWVLLFPDAGEAVQRGVSALLAQMTRLLGAVTANISRQAPSVAEDGRAGMQLLAALLRRHWILLTVACALVVLPPLAVWLAGGKVALPESGARSINPQLESLLRGEHLVPPPPLPPMVFTSAEVTVVRPMLDTANRNWTLLDSEFSQRLLVVFKIMREQHGYEMALLEGYRSPERQNQLADAGNNVTSARAFQSYHQYGLAADCAFMRDGHLVISERDPWAMRGYQLYGEVAESVGLNWGGRWTMMDFGHIELRKPRKEH
ncbi:M15 family metallopeptidase [Pseudoduganella sp. RAF53_2]|uniref:M15 family metallopeptidase n=1 Tax=unclassified Pseudoduganella TaxID=2637179 RepID=UPI003F977AC4